MTLLAQFLEPLERGCALTYVYKHSEQLETTVGGCGGVSTSVKVQS